MRASLHHAVAVLVDSRVIRPVSAASPAGDKTTIIAPYIRQPLTVMNDESFQPEFDRLHWAVRSIREEMLAIEAGIEQKKQEIELEERKLSDLKWKWWDAQLAVANGERKEMAQRRQDAEFQAEIKEWVPD